MNVDLLQKDIEKKGWLISRLPDDSADFASQRLAIFLGWDAKKREVVLELTQRNAALLAPSAPFLSSLKTKETIPSTFEFCFTFPFLVEETSLGQIAHLLHFINHTSPFPGFGLEELRHRLFFRYVWVTSSHCEESLISAILDLIALNLSLFTEPLESVATGSLSFNEWLEKISPQG